MKSFVAGFVVVAVSSLPAFAQSVSTDEEKSATPTVTASERIAAVCSLSNVVLSEKAVAVCADGMGAPTLIADGSRFSMRGVGAEFNALFANVDNFK